MIPPRKKKLVLSATCHGQVVESLLNSSSQFNRYFSCLYIPNFQVSDDGFGLAPIDNLLSAMEDCDVLVYHDVYGLSYSQILDLLPPYAVAIPIPYPTTLIYWPTHSLDAFWLAKSDGVSLIPFPCKILNTMIDGLRDKRRILNEYLAADLTKMVDMNENFSCQMAYLERCQANTPFDVASFVGGSVVSQRLFHLPNHPALPLFEYIVGELLELLGLEKITSMDVDPFLSHQTPIHPSVAKYYDLSWCNDDFGSNLVDRTVDFSGYVELYVDAYVKEKMNKVVV